VPGTLSQQMLLAVLARDSGDEAGAAALAREIARWAAAIGAESIKAQATSFLAGADPTAPPESSS
jgi:type IV pilus biogenesis protein CpaD/CtpE